MLQSGPIRHKAISNSLKKLQNVSSDKRFRIKSLRVKTIQNENPLAGTVNVNTTIEQLITKKQMASTSYNNHIDKDYQGELNSAGFSSEWLYQLYAMRSEQAKLKVSIAKYKAFVKLFYHRLFNTVSLTVSTFNFQTTDTLHFFFLQFIKWNCSFITIDLSTCETIAIEDILRFITDDKRMVKLLLRNMSLSEDKIRKILQKVCDQERLYQLDLSNIGSLSMNRFGETFECLEKFSRINQTVGIVRLDNLALRKHGVQAIVRGIEQWGRYKCPIKTLNIKNNALSEHCAEAVSILAQSGLESLDISENPLTQEFVFALPSWKSSSLKTLNLSSTLMSSQGFCTFLSKVEQNKSLVTLIANNNDFSHHWFSQTRSLLQVNSSIESLCLINCNIKFMSSLFEGLTYNRYLKNLNVSQNLFDTDPKQNISSDKSRKKITDCFEINRCLQQVKMRFCNLKERDFLQIWDALEKNKNMSLKVLEISENQLGDKGGRALIKILNKGPGELLEYVGTQKVQISMRVKKDIDEKMRENRDIREKAQFRRLKIENKIVKQKDQYTWDDLTQFQAEVQQNQEWIETLNSKISTISSYFDTKKLDLQQWLVQAKKQERELDMKIKVESRRKTQQNHRYQEMVKEMGQKADKIVEDQQIQKRLIENFQKLIRKENEKIKKRENQLEDLYNDKKYLNKKRENQNNGKKEIPFDNTKSLIKAIGKKKSIERVS